MTNSRRWTKSDFIYALIAGVLFIITVIRLFPTYTIFTQTYDEPFHVACGMEWLDKGTYNYEWQHPPLARVAVALVPYVEGLRSHSLLEPITEGNRILASDGRYWRNLQWARLGNLPFLFLACVVIFVWARRWFSAAAGVWALLLFLNLPPILGHAALATLDLGCAATVAAALYQLMRWLEEPSWKQSIGLSIALTLAFATKFSSIGFLLVCGIAAVAYLLLVGRTRIATRGQLQLGLRIGQTGVIILTTCFLIWTSYRFSLDPISDKVGSHPSVDKWLGRAPGLARVASKALEQPVPLTLMIRGILHVYMHNKEGHDSYLFGKYSRKGWWYFFPVVVAVKTPIGFLLLATVGLLLVFLRLRSAPWQQCLTAIFPVAILLFCLTSGINLGARHILSIYPFLALAAGHAIYLSWQQKRRVATVATMLLAGWVVVDSAIAHPDYLAYFNQFAGDHPERILVESDLDWGQDLHRLSQRLRALGVQQLAIGYFGTADLDNAELPEHRDLLPFEKATGYVAVSMHLTTLEYAKNGAYGWLKSYSPVEKIGKSIYLYRIER